jgi:hypothetical protein
MKHIEKFQNFKTISESLKYHIDNDLSLCESVYRVESDAWLDLIIEARDLYKDGKIELSDDDIWLVETLVGEKGTFEGEEVLLDIPFEIVEAYNYEYEDFTLADMEYVKDLYNDGITDPEEIRREMDFKDFSIETIIQIISALKTNGSINEAEYHGKKVDLNKPHRTSGGPKKFAVYTKNDKGNIVKVGFGDPHLSVKNNNPKKAKSFRARHHCENPGPKWKAKYWSCNVGRYAKLLGLKSNRPW